jgi:predicted small integral membrane protein
MFDYIVYTLAPLIAVLAVILYAIGLMVSAARQHPAGILKYKKAITAAIIGLTIIFLAAGMVNLWSNIIGN